MDETAVHAPPTTARQLAQRYRERLSRAVVDDRTTRFAALRAGSVAAIWRALSGSDLPGDDPAQASLGARLRLALCGVRGAVGGDAAGCGQRLLSTPPIRRSPMAPRRPWRLRALALLRSRPANLRARWHRTAAWRRATLLVPLLLQAWIATLLMHHVLPANGARPLEIVLLALYAILNAWIGVGLWTALAGFVLLLRGGDRYAIAACDGAGGAIDAAARTAIVMPICNEDVARVFAGLRATCESVARSAAPGSFDFFVLSDTSDPDLRVAERAAWLDLRRAGAAAGRVFYRLRRHRIKRKSGNIADFCRRWGRNYRYMVVLDADSVMSGACLVELVRMMEANPDAGIIQTAPRASGRDTMYARVQQFASRLYGPLFVAGMHFWQLGESHYWGHNAIIRVAPFIEHCALARLPGRGTLSGEILSHDFVEAALMRRAGWGVWTAYDLPGSYEEMPPNLLDELKRDRRWCQGNLINSRLLFAAGLHPAHRAVFATGVMAYVSAPLWFAFLALSTLALALYTLAGPSYFVEWHQLFRLWPQWHPARAIALCSATAAILFLPKLLAIVLALRNGARAFGGAARLAGSALVEIAFSSLLAPVRMLVHTQFVVTSLIGWKVEWKSPPRGDSETGWVEAMRRHGWHTAIGLGWAAFVYRLNPGLIWWLLPVAGALALSIPLSVLSSRVAFGRRLRAAGLFVTPEEAHPPQVLRRMRRHLACSAALPGFADAIVDPLENALACASDSARARHSAPIRHAHLQLVERALAGGPTALDADERRVLLGDASALAQLHRAVWTRDDIAACWRAARTAAPPRLRARAVRDRAAIAAPRAAATATDTALAVSRLALSVPLPPPTLRTCADARRLAP